ncbi:MAG TPA: hypothetical protein VGK67_40870 [Myxococcales bacterium]
MTTQPKAPKSRSRRTAPTLPSMAGMDKPGQVWFSPTGCVVRSDERVDVYLEREHLASYEDYETDIRNVLLVMLAKKKAVVLEKLAEAFGISSETLRQIRRLHEAEGIDAVVRRRRGGLRGRPKKKVTRGLERRLQAWFEQGVSIDDAHERVRGKISRASVGNVHKRWVDAKAAAPAQPVQQELGLATTPGAVEERPAEPTPVAETRATVEGPAEQSGELRAPRDESAHEVRAARDEAEESEPVSRRSVQHLGSWLLVSLVAARGFHERAQRLLPEDLRWSSVRICLDSVLTALAVRQKCVEGVRRLATSGAAALLIAPGAPSPSWARRVLGGYCRDGVSLDLHTWQAGELIREAWQRREEGRPVPLFADNHTRPYTGLHELLWHWRMQDKRARPGASDYYVHDRSGRPLFRFTASQGSLAQFLPAVAAIAKLALDADARFILGFDRGGAFPEAMAALRAAPGVEFITYERGPYRKLPRHCFEKHGEKIEIAGEKPGETQTLPGARRPVQPRQGARPGAAAASADAGRLAGEPADELAGRRGLARGHPLRSLVPGERVQVRGGALGHQPARRAEGRGVPNGDGGPQQEEAPAHARGRRTPRAGRHAATQPRAARGRRLERTGEGSPGGTTHASAGAASETRGAPQPPARTPPGRRNRACWKARTPHPPSTRR